MRLCLRKIGVCLMVCLLLLVSVMPVYAATGDEDAIIPMAMYYSSARADLSISSNGVATVEGSVVGIIGTTTKTSVYVYLQRYEGGTWVDAYDWSETNNSVSTTISETQNVAKGYRYRVKASCYAYSGSNSEHVIKYSGEVSYL